MIPTFIASVTWSPSRLRRPLPTGSNKYVHPARFICGGPPWLDNDTWSLVCTFPAPPASLSNPTLALVEFLVPEAPTNRLASGTRLWLYEGAEWAATIDVVAPAECPMPGWRRQLASDVQRDGFGAEILDHDGQIRLEVFRSDAEHAVIVTSYGPPVPPAVETWFKSIAAAVLQPFEDGSALPPAEKWRLGAV